MKIAILDAKTLGEDLDLSIFSSLGDVTIYPTTTDNEVQDRIIDVDIVIINKIKLNRNNLTNAKSLKLICVAATGFDNIDIDYCWKNEIGVCNVVGYSTHSVAQVTLSMVLSLYTHIEEYKKYVQSGKYTESRVQNYLNPTYHELHGKTWGIVGIGNIGRQVARVARVMGCRVIAYKRSADDEFECVDIDKLCRESDIISVHLPLSDETRNLINKQRIEMMKKNAILINIARGAIVDEYALVEAVEKSQIGGIGIDVYSNEPFDEHHPYNKIMKYDNVILTPHMAWGAYEARVRCMEEIAENIRAFYNGEKRNRIEL